jgi:hypothetical protein
VGCNPGPNIIVPKPFSVVDMENLGDDLLHLKSTLWPLLETLYRSKNVRHFGKRFRSIMAAAEHTVTELTQTVTRRKTGINDYVATTKTVHND